MNRKSVCILQRTATVAAFMFLLLICIFVGSSMLSTSKVRASGQKSNHIYYKSIQIQSGDSLWTIASRYQTQESDDISSYINQIKNINHLDSSKIHAGQYLTIPYDSYGRL